MKKAAYIKHLISRIRYDRLLLAVLFIFLICFLIGWIFRHLTNTENQSIEANNTPDNVILNDNESGKITLTDIDNDSPEAINTADEYVIDDFDVIYQLPELPTGCEITALTMILNYYGCDISKTEMAEYYLPTAEYDLHYDGSGYKIGPDINCFFIGDPKSESGFVCGSKAIQNAANNYFYDMGINYEASEFVGLPPEELYDIVSEGTPVFVLVTIGMEDREETKGWYTEDGDYVQWSTNDHGAVLIGYSSDTITIADPISGIIEYEREQFEKVYEQRERKCVIIQNVEN